MVGKSRLSRREAIAGTWVGRVCAAGAAGLAVAILAGGGASSEALVVEPVVAPGPQPSQPELETTSALGDIGLIVVNLEAWDGPGPEAEGAGPPTAGTAATSQGPGLAYLGMIRLGDRVRALMSADGRQRFVKAGDRIGSATIVSITETYVMVDERGRPRRVVRQMPSAQRLGYLGSTGPPIRIEDGRGSSVLNGGDDGSAARRRELRQQMARTRLQDRRDAASVNNPASRPGGNLPPAPGSPDAPGTMSSPDAPALRLGAPSASSDAAEGS